MRRKTPEMNRRRLLENLLAPEFDDQSVFMRESEIVLAARAFVAEHGKRGWPFEVDDTTGVLLYKTVCECPDCARLTPIAGLVLPGERATRAPPQ